MSTDQPNGGLCIDAWHFFRGEADFRALADVPSERVFSVQLDDAAADVVGSL